MFLSHTIHTNFLDNGERKTTDINAKCDLLRLKIIAGHSLANSDFNSLSDPYTQISLINIEDNTGKP